MLTALPDDEKSFLEYAHQHQYHHLRICSRPEQRCKQKQQKNEWTKTTIYENTSVRRPWIIEDS